MRAQPGLHPAKTEPRGCLDVDDHYYSNTGGAEMKKLIVCGALAAFALGTQAASAAEFYVVRDATTKKCTVVDSKPTTTTTTVVGNGVYKTKTEAESAVKTTKVCTEQ
jgi:hypothetical protein